jgi:hypothetical protein
MVGRAERGGALGRLHRVDEQHGDGHRTDAAGHWRDQRGFAGHSFKIHIANQRGRDAMVAGRSLTSTRQIHWVDERGDEATSRKILRAGYAQDFEALRARFGEEPDAIAQALIDGDPEVDLERFGSVLNHPVRVYAGPGQTLVHHVVFQEIVRGPDGVEKARRPRRESESFPS